MNLSKYSCPLFCYLNRFYNQKYPTIVTPVTEVVDGIFKKNTPSFFLFVFLE
jgi:hypothetical protein